MSQTIDLNADMGEGAGEDDALLDIISSANVACGCHAGDWREMARVMALAQTRGVNIGAHPGFDDRDHFGRREITLPAAELRALIAHQVGAARAVAATQGATLTHVKLHGALANMAARDEALAETCFEAALTAAPETALMVIAGTAQDTVARRLGAPIISEVFADRGYAPDGTLLPRGAPGAVLTDPAEVAARVVAMVSQGALLPQDAPPRPTQIDSICLHGDTPGALALARAVRRALENAGWKIAPLS